MTHWLNKHVADRGVSPHEDSNALFKSIADVVEIVELVHVDSDVRILESLDDVKRYLEWSIACRSIRF